jgi:hypothetical protein
LRSSARAQVNRNGSKLLCCMIRKTVKDILHLG